jgi:adenosylcobinamide kinase/adenosylcobinamide-phosphate guanylyltransferase
MKSLILGGVKSGKSRYAENCVKAFIAKHQLSGDSVCLIATAEALDDAMLKRIENHKLQRPDSWSIIEEPINLASAVLAAEKTSKIILIDCLTLWLTNLLMLEDESKLSNEIEIFLKVASDCTAELVIVSNETNMGVMPLGDLTRDYCDKVGTLHQSLAEVCDHVSLVVAGLPLSLKYPIGQE